MKRKLEITERECVDWIDEQAWRRVGFKNREALEESVRNLPLEDRVNMLTEICMHDMAKIHLQKKKSFLEGLGHKTWVDGNEIYEWARMTYIDKDDVEWKIDPYDFQSHAIRIDGLFCSQIDSIYVNRLKKKIQGN